MNARKANLSPHKSRGERWRNLESVPKALCCGPSPWSLVPKPIPVLRPGQPTEHQLNHADPDLHLAGISQVFIILAVNPAPTPTSRRFAPPPTATATA